MTTNEIKERFITLEAQVQTDRDRLAQSENRLRVTWAVSVFAALTMLFIGWHKDAIAQGYGITLAQAATRITALETKTASISAITDPNTSQPTVRFTGVNVQVVSGSGFTEGTVNGTGNLIIGYNELRKSVNSPDVRTGSHNLVVGLYNNYGGDGGAVIGYYNSISNLEACVVGGYLNTASGSSACVSGGYLNTASGLSASVSGSSGSTASADYSSVSGSSGSTASGQYSSVSGGRNNTASGLYSSVSGGAFITQGNTNGFSAGGTYSAASPGAGTFHSP